jgi:phosphoribosylanthranilate isomerase
VVKVKICGITNKMDAMKAAALGADMLGFILYKKSARYVEPRTIRDIANELPDSVKKVGVFVDEGADSVRALAEDSSLDVLQFHGDEDPAYCAKFKDGYGIIKAFSVKDTHSLKDANDYDVDYILLDTHSEALKGGTGTVFDWKLIEAYEFLKPVILSGGLTPDNVMKAIQSVSPYGVDVSSGVEAAPGRKDASLLEKFFENARKA